MSLLVLVFASCLSHAFPLRFSTHEAFVWDNASNEQLSDNRAKGRRQWRSI